MTIEEKLEALEGLLLGGLERLEATEKRLDEIAEIVEELAKKQKLEEFME